MRDLDYSMISKASRGSVPFYTTGDFDKDTARLIEAWAEADEEQKWVRCIHNGGSVTINAGILLPIHRPRIDFNGATLVVKVGAGGFNTVDIEKQWNPAGHNTCLFYHLNGEGAEICDLTITQDEEDEVVICVLGIRGGYDEHPGLLSDVRLKNLRSGRSHVSINSTGVAAGRIVNCTRENCYITTDHWMRGASPAGTMDVGFLTFDTDMLDGFSEAPWTIRDCSDENASFQGDALSAYEDQTDSVTNGGIGNTNGVDIMGFRSKTVGEGFDDYGSGSKVVNFEAEDVYFAVTPKHGGMNGQGKNITATRIRDGGAVVAFNGSSIEGARDTANWHFSGVIGEDFQGGGYVVLIQENGGGTGKPKRCVVEGVVARGADNDKRPNSVVKCNLTPGAEAGNVVRVEHGEWRTDGQSIVVLDGANTRVFGPARGLLEVRLSAAQTLTEDVLTTVEFDTVEVEEGGTWSGDDFDFTPDWPDDYTCILNTRIGNTLDTGDAVELRVVGGAKSKMVRHIAPNDASEPVYQGACVVRITEAMIGSSAAKISATALVDADETVDILATESRTWFQIKGSR